MKRSEAFPDQPARPDVSAALDAAAPPLPDDAVVAALDAADAPSLALAAAVIDRAATVTRQAAEYRRRAEEALMAYIIRHGQFTIGNTRYYVGEKTVHSCPDNRRAFAAILEALGGDLERAVDVIRSGGIKAGSSRAILGDDFGKYFTTEKIGELKYGSPTKRLQKAYTLSDKPIDDDDQSE